MELVITTLIWAAVLQGVLLGFIFIFSKKHKSFSNKLLGLFLITFILGASSDLLPFVNIGSYSIAGYFTLPEVKMLFPVLFLHYVLAKIGRSAAYNRFLKINYILAFAIIAITFVNIFFFLFTGKAPLDSFEFDTLDRFFMIHQYYAFLLTVAAVGISIVETLKYRNLVRNEYSDITLLSINWLWQFILIFVPIVILWGTELVRILFGGVGQSDIVTVIWGLVAIIIYIVSFKAFTHQDLFHNQPEKKNDEVIESKPSEEIKDETQQTVCEKIKIAMEEGRFFLNHDLSIHDFARDIEVSSRTISTCINKNFGFNFNEWVNNYRVEAALSILQDQEMNHLSIEGVGSESGFKSRSAMYTAFKKKTGKTPGHFRES